MQNQPGKIGHRFAVLQSSDGDGKEEGRESLRQIDGMVAGTDGHYLDGAPSEQDHQDEVTAAVTLIAEHRGGIEQAKGMLMLVYGMDAQAAFELLKWRSQETNTKLRLLARQVVADFVALSGRETLPPRTAFDNVLFTAHLGVDADAESGDEDTG